MKRISDTIGRLLTYIREFGSLTPIALVTAVLPIVISTSLLAFGLPLGYWLRENREPGIFIFFAGVVFFCGLSLLPTNVIGLVAGFAFGFPLGLTVLIAGVVSAATTAYLLDSKIAGNRFGAVVEKHQKAKVVYDALIGQSLARTTLIIFLLRLSPAMPFALTNFLMASARVPLRAFVAGTFLGMLPRSAAVVLVGSGLSELSLDNPQEFWLLVFGVAATIVSIIVISIFARRALDRLTSVQPPITLE